VNQPDHTNLEQAILRYLGSQPPSEGSEGTLYVKVTELERVTHPPNSSQFRGGLFLSVPFVGAERARPVGAGRDRAPERFLIERQAHDAAEQVRELQIIPRYPAEKDSALGVCAPRRRAFIRRAQRS
jgi:hypothetical protein